MALKCLNKQRWVWSREIAAGNREALLATGMISSISTTFLPTVLIISRLWQESRESTDEKDAHLSSLSSLHGFLI